MNFCSTSVQLHPAPLDPSMILQGAPVARNFGMSHGRGSPCSTWIWECTPGLFDWIYETEETFLILEGTVILENEKGDVRRLGAGDLCSIPAGSRVRWNIEATVRKVAFFGPRKRTVANLLRSVRDRLQQMLARKSYDKTQPAQISP